jgi:hypothetical protein
MQSWALISHLLSGQNLIYRQGSIQYLFIYNSLKDWPHVHRVNFWEQTDLTIVAGRVVRAEPEDAIDQVCFESSDISKNRPWCPMAGVAACLQWTDSNCCRIRGSSYCGLFSRTFSSPPFVGPHRPPARRIASNRDFRTHCRCPEAPFKPICPRAGPSGTFMRAQPSMDGMHHRVFAETRFRTNGTCSLAEYWRLFISPARGTR